MLLAGSLMASAYHRQASLRPCHPWGYAEGRSPFAGSLRVSLSSSFQFPQEWGTQGVERGLHNSLRLLPWIPAPRVHEDMLRENDMRRVFARARPCRGLGGVPQLRAGVIARSEATKQSRGGVM